MFLIIIFQIILFFNHFKSSYFIFCIDDCFKLFIQNKHLGLVSSANFQYKTFPYLILHQLTNFQYQAIFTSQSMSFVIKLIKHHKLLIYLWSSS